MVWVVRSQVRVIFKFTDRFYDVLWFEFTWFRSRRDHTLRFRNSLVKMGAFDDLLDEVCRQIETQGLKMKHSKGAIIDATLITSAARPSKYNEVLQDEDGNEIPGEQGVKYSADPKEMWGEKGTKLVMAIEAMSEPIRRALLIKSMLPLPIYPKTRSLKR